MATARSFFGYSREEYEAGADQRQEDAERDRLVFLLDLQLYGAASEADIAELAVLRHRFRKRS
jgi:hypothetical protein